MPVNKLFLQYTPHPEEDDNQQVEGMNDQQMTQMKFLFGVLESYRTRASLTDWKIRLTPEYERFWCQRKEFKSLTEEYHDFEMKMERPVISLDKDMFPFEKVGDHYWDIVLTAPKKAIEVHEISQRTEFFVKKILEENYSYLIPEITSLGELEGESALRLSDTLEESLNISKLETDNRFQKRIIEDFQWNMIEIKKSLFDLVSNVNVEKARKKLMESIDELEKKILAVEEMKKALDELGIDEDKALREFTKRELPNGRVELVWKKSG